jgi:putative endonuclease
MTNYIETGKRGEALAATYLSDLGFEILERNWRYRRSEIDLIGSKDGILHCIEVKTRTSTTFGFPEESVTNKKIKSLLRAGTAYMFKNPGWKIIQYDVLSIMIYENAPIEYLFIQDIDI